MAGPTTGAESWTEAANDGKADFDDIYDQPDPRAYFRTLGKLDYQIPKKAKPIFKRLIAAIRSMRRLDRATILDVGCSYGVNAALLKYNIKLPDLIRRYTAPELDAVTSQQMLARDQAYFQAKSCDDDIWVIGLDVAENAVAYAERIGAVDVGISEDLERADPTGEIATATGGTDLIISTGCVGYVTEHTFRRLIRLTEQGRRPWIANFVLRMFPYDRIADALAAHGLRTEKFEGSSFRQRRFLSGEEREHKMDTIYDQGLDPAGYETDGYYHAELYLSRPSVEIARLPLARLIDRTGAPIPA